VNGKVVLCSFYAVSHRCHQNFSVTSNVTILGSLLGQSIYIDFIRNMEPRDVLNQRI